MLVSTAALLPRHQDDLVLKNALLESFAIHLRALTDFFFPPSSSKPDDVLATDFLSALPYSVELPATLEASRGRVHKEVAHLTYGRQEVAEEAKKWVLKAILAEILTLANTFIRKVPDDTLGGRWGSDEHGLRIVLSLNSSGGDIAGTTTSTLAATMAGAPTKTRT